MANPKPKTLLPLPVDAIIPQVLAAFEKSQSVVVQASPGSGKTTRIPPALLKHAGTPGEILVLEPRRLAAKLAARRVAEELGERVGETVGYQFRFENVSSPRTRLRFLTEGMLMRRLLSDPELRGVSAVVLDEFHERHLHGDLALAYLKALQERRPIRVIVMSATLDTESLSKYFANCPTIRIEAPVFPVQIEHLPSAPAKHLDVTVRDAVAQLSSRPDCTGDILVFLPGMGDILRAASALTEVSQRKNLLIAPLHGELSREEQDVAIQKADRKKVILATNVAETSLTIEGVTGVIDSGLHRIASYSWWSGVPALKTRPISKASAIQRAGRAGRTAPGVCLRLYTKGDFDGRSPFDTPEIRRADLTQTVLELKSLGVRDLESFPWFEQPSKQSLDASTALLYRLGALKDSSATGSLTDLGKKMVQIPAHPRIARILIEGIKQGLVDECATLAALLQEGRIETLDALEVFERNRPSQPGRSAVYLDEASRKAKSQLEISLKGFQVPASNPNGARASRQDRLRFCVLTGFPDRVARKRAHPSLKPTEKELVFSSGGSARVEEAGILAEGDLFVTLDIQEKQHLGQARSQLSVRSVSLIREEWLFDLEPSMVEEREALVWDEQRKRVTASEQIAYDQLILTESRGEPRDLEGAAKVLLRSGLGVSTEALEKMELAGWTAALAKITDPEKLESTVARIALFQKHHPSELDIAGRDLSKSILELMKGRFSLRELEELDWPAQLIALLGLDAYSRFEEEVPEFTQLARARRAKIQYKPGAAPWVESRLQDFFGLKQGPTILRGKLPLTLHLLAPNMRAVQVTTDLAGFWQRAYAEVRGQLSRRYPRHSWPENPLELMKEDPDRK